MRGKVYIPQKTRDAAGLLTHLGHRPTGDMKVLGSPRVSRMTRDVTREKTRWSERTFEALRAISSPLAKKPRFSMRTSRGDSKETDRKPKSDRELSFSLPPLRHSDATS